MYHDPLSLVGRYMLFYKNKIFYNYFQFFQGSYPLPLNMGSKCFYESELSIELSFKHFKEFFWIFDSKIWANLCLGMLISFMLIRKKLVFIWINEIYSYLTHSQRLQHFSQYSAARREDYKAITDCTELATQFVLRHVQTRWLSIQKVLLRIIEQFTNLKEYYIEFLPKQKGFNYKEGVGKTERYTRIKNLLSGPSFMPYAHFVITVAQDFKKFVLLFQRNEPMIHALHPEMMTLMQRLLSRFIKPDAILNKKGGLKSVTKLAKLNLCDENIQKVCCKFVKLYAFEKCEFQISDWR